MATTNDDLTLEQIRARIAGMSHAEKVQLAAQAKRIREHRQETATSKSGAKAPQTDDELHAAILEETGYDIPRVAVCEDHCAPFEPIADGFFHRQPGILILKSREAGGTLNVSILQYMLCKFVPRHEGVTFGSIATQAEKAFSYVKEFVQETTTNPDGTIDRRVKPEIDGEPLQKRIRWKVGSLLSIIIATISGVNSPHPNTAHADELDLMDEDVIAQAANMSSSTVLPDGTHIPALDVITSTRKSMHGPMQRMIDEIADAESKGYEASYKLYAYCIAEVAKEVPCCRGADPDARRARLLELNRDPNELCSCDQTVKAEWDEDVPRTLESVCRGRFFRSRGWMPHEDVKRKFRKNSQAVWEAEMECRRPMADGLYLPGWSRQRFCTVGWNPRPELGPIWLGVDWGATDLTFVLWAQGPLSVPVTIAGTPHPETGAERLVTVPRHAYVVFDEYYEAETGAGKIADQVIAREISWRRQLANFRVLGRFADMAGKQQRLDWREHNPPLRTVWYLPDRNKEPMIKNLQDLVADKRLWIDSRCARHMDDIESWRQKEGREVHDQSSHSAAALRYMLANTEAYQRKRGFEHGADVSPVVIQRGQAASPRVLSARGVSDMQAELSWRRDLGGPVPGGRR